MAQKIVWDRYIRLFHWGLVATIAGAAVTGFLMGAEALLIHIVTGTLAVILVTSRIVWGFLGGTYARFSSFTPRPRDVLAHLRGGGVRHLGHNPLGALMVLALLATILGIGLSGLAVLGGTLKTGPLSGLSFDLGRTLREGHELLATGLLVLIGLHLGGVIFESLRSRENLARAMVTGRKPSRAGDHPDAPRKAHPRAAIALGAVLVLVLGLGGLAIAATNRPVPGAPVAEWDALTQDECSACHMTYHPSLLPRTNWRALMAGLDDHFGEDASLPADATRQITDWLEANAAETADTLPARRLGLGAQADTLRLTETRFWKRTHRDIPDATFTRKPVLSRANCRACHADAETGWFSPFQISIPKETLQ